MIKRCLMVLLIFISVISGYSQAVSGKVEYQKSQQPAAIVELPYKPELVEGALKDHFSKKGSKESSSKGFSLFKNVQLSAADASSSDLYFKIDRKSRKDSDVSVVYMVVTKANESPATRSSEDNSGIEQAVHFLNDIGPSIESYSLEQEIKGQDEAVKKAEKRYNNLLDEGKELEKRKRTLEDRIMENIQDMEKQKNEVEKQKQALESLSAKRRM